MNVRKKKRSPVMDERGYCRVLSRGRCRLGQIKTRLSAKSAFKIIIQETERIKLVFLFFFFMYMYIRWEFVGLLSNEPARREACTIYIPTYLRPAPCHNDPRQVYYSLAIFSFSFSLPLFRSISPSPLTVYTALQ